MPVERGVISTSRIGPRTPARYVQFVSATLTTAASTIGQRWMWPHAAKGRLVDVIMTQFTAGVGGTSWTADVRKTGGTSMLTTAGVLTLASGVNATVEAKGEAALPGGCTRPVIKTDGTQILSKGDYFDFLITETGTYGTHVIYCVTLVFEPAE